MAVYFPASSWAVASEICKIPRTESKDGTTVYVIEISVSPFTWYVKHRYNDFRQLHEKITASHHVDKSLLPPKKWIGCQSELFIAKRQADLQLYVQTLIHQFNNHLPPALSIFLDFPLYEVRGIVGKLAEKFFYQGPGKFAFTLMSAKKSRKQMKMSNLSIKLHNLIQKIYWPFSLLIGDLLLQSEQSVRFSPVELHSILERLKLAEPTFSDKNKVQDIGHLLSFISEVRQLIIKGSHENIGSSNIVPNNLVFSLTHFKKLRSLKIQDCVLKDTLQSIEPVNQSVQNLSVQNTLEDISSLTLCGIIHWSPYDNPNIVPMWKYVTILNLSHNFLTIIHPSIKLFPSVEHLDLSYNNIQEIENFECLPCLAYLNLSYNNIHHIVPLHTRLGNIRSLRLNGNSIDSLQGFSRLFSLVELELQNNCITSLLEVASISKLPCLEKLKFTNNPVCDSIDYRAHVLKAFGSRVNELTLDSVKPCQQELDTVSLLQALDASQQNSANLDQKDHLNEKDRNNPTSSICSYVGIQYSQRLNGRSDFFEYRQQVTALRKLGGVNWLSLLNQMQGDPVKDEKIGLLNADSQSSCKASGCLNTETVSHSSNINPIKSSIDYLANLQCTFPEWVLAIDASDQNMIDYLLSLALSDPILKVPLASLSKPEKFLWLIYSPQQNMSVSQIPVCALLFHSEIIIFKIEDFPQISCSEDLHLKPILPTMSCLRIFYLSDMSFLAGPCKSYIEICINSDDGIYSYVFLLPNSVFANMYIEMLEDTYKITMSFKESPFFQEILNLEMLCSDKDFIHGSMIQCQILFSERIILLQTVGACSLSNVHYLTVTPSHVILIEEKINFPNFYNIQCSQFRACTVIGAQTNVSNIYMDSDCGLFTTEQTYKSKMLKGSIYKNPWKKEYADAPWLFLEFDHGIMMQIVFLCLQDRSNFLDALLCARTLHQ